MKQIELASGVTIPALGLGTWRMGESSSTTAASSVREIGAIRHAIELGYRLFDTAEMYGEGGAESVLGRALADALRSGAVAREEIFVVSKVYPHNANRKGVQAACDRSRRRLGLDTLDVYLLHWRGAVPIAETVEAFDALAASGAIRAWGVSNFDVDDLIEIEHLAPTGRSRCATNQVYYALDERGAEFGLMPYQRTVRMPTMAYCPLGQGALATNAALRAIGDPRGASAAQVALAWTMRQGDVVAIPKAVDLGHLSDNFAAAAIELTGDELKAIDGAFPPPVRKKSLAMV